MVVEKQQILYGSDVAAPTIFNPAETENDSFYASPNVYRDEMRVPLVPGAFFGAGCHVYHRERCFLAHFYVVWR